MSASTPFWGPNLKAGSISNCSGKGLRQDARRLPIGAEVLGRGTHFRVWAPNSKRVRVRFSDDAKFVRDNTRAIELTREPGGYHSGFVEDLGAGALYQYELETGWLPDPASRFQPEGPPGPSQIVDPAAFKWQDHPWPGIPHSGQVFYEMHIGTFTAQGTWAAAANELAELAQLGITAVEVMPVAEFPGRFGWGYDGVNLFAPTRLYGLPDDFRSFVNRAHVLGLGVILDVVYNHLGPDGNYLPQFSAHYFTDRQNLWGRPINFDGKQSRPVREFFLANAAYWIQEFHLDGLRLDATQQIFDASPEHILAALSRRVREVAGSRSVYLVAENEKQDSILVRPLEKGGYGLDALWNDDFHHSARVAATEYREAYYSDYAGAPQEFISAAKWGYLFQGQGRSGQEDSRGTPSLGIEPARFVTYIENHDQIANSPHGLRLHQLTSPGRLRALTALLLLGPGTPMLFQGQEFGASTPFLFFADHNPELAALVAKGRRQFLSQFPEVRNSEAGRLLPDPGTEETFTRCKLDFSERQTHSAIYKLHRDLLKLRREDSVFSKPRPRGIDGAVLGPHAFILRFFDESGQDRLLVVNLGPDLCLGSAPEPLLAPVAGFRWGFFWSSEAPCYGGNGVPPLPTDGPWVIPGNAAIVLTPEPVHEQDYSPDRPQTA